MGEKKGRKQKREGKRQVKMSAEAGYTGARSSVNIHLIKADPAAAAMYGTGLNASIMASSIDALSSIPRAKRIIMIAT